MMKSEFEALALRGNATIGDDLYRSIERFYMSENDYHAAHGGIYETKREFVKRVFGGKVNTPKTIALKIAEESCRENRWMLRGTHVDRDELDNMDVAILNFYQSLYRYGM